MNASLNNDDLNVKREIPSTPRTPLLQAIIRTGCMQILLEIAFQITVVLTTLLYLTIVGFHLQLELDHETIWPYSKRPSFSVTGDFNPLGVIDLATKWRSLIAGSPAPYTQYWIPRNESQHIWKIPHSLKAHGISLVALKNQNIFMKSPASQLASTETRKPLHDLVLIFDTICGRGRVASTARPRYPMKDE